MIDSTSSSDNKSGSSEASKWIWEYDSIMCRWPSENGESTEALRDSKYDAQPSRMSSFYRVSPGGPIAGWERAISGVLPNHVEETLRVSNQGRQRISQQKIKRSVNLSTFWMDVPLYIILKAGTRKGKLCHSQQSYRKRHWTLTLRTAAPIWHARAVQVPQKSILAQYYDRLDMDGKPTQHFVFFPRHSSSY